jgi:rod shape-determining protein MreC
VSQDRRRGATLTFGGSDGVGADPAPDVPVALPTTLERRAQPLPPARRARQRRRAAQRRSRARMREGSEALLAFLILAGLTLLLIDAQTEGRAYDVPREAAAVLLGPLQAGADSLVRDESVDPDALAEQQRMLAEQSAAAADQRRLQELEALFGLVSRSRQEVIGAGVVALDARSGSLAATIDRGTQDGVDAEQAVLAGSGVIGKVTTANATSAVVQLAADPRFAVGARLAETGESAIVRGTGDPARLTMELLDPMADIAVGDQVVTVGSPQGRPFPPGLVVGTVTDLGEQGLPTRVVTLAPAADLTKVSVAAVLRPPALQVAP